MSVKCVAVKMKCFGEKTGRFLIIIIFAQNMDCNEGTQNLRFKAKIRKMYSKGLFVSIRGST